MTCKKHNYYHASIFPAHSEELYPRYFCLGCLLAVACHQFNFRCFQMLPCLNYHELLALFVLAKAAGRAKAAPCILLDIELWSREAELSFFSFRSLQQLRNGLDCLFEVQCKLPFINMMNQENFCLLSPRRNISHVYIHAQMTLFAELCRHVKLNACFLKFEGITHCHDPDCLIWRCKVLQHDFVSWC